MIHESIDGADAGLSPAETALSRALSNAGYKIVSSEVAKKLHAQQTVALMMDGRLPDEVSSLDADLLLVGKAAANGASSLMPDIHTYMARLEI